VGPGEPLLARAIELIATERGDLAALAAAPPELLGAPWDLEESGRMTGEGPLAIALPQMAGSR
jgi:hypothetical protein